ncbi:MAG: dihydroxy-acid dehydratase, partial [Chloroflexota bacterium]
MTYTITPEQWSQYETEGYFIAKNVVSKEAVDQLHAKITAVLTKGKKIDPEGELNFDNKRTDDENLMGAAMFRKLARLGRNDPDIWDLYYASDNVRSINQQFLGGNVRLWFDSIFTKPAKIGEATPWHQDIGLWTQNPAQKKNKPRYKDALTVSGTAIWDEVRNAVNHNTDVILPVDRALTQQGGIAVVKGNLAPNGAVLKPSAASPHLLSHRGRAVVFEDIDDYKARINDDALDIDETCVMVLKNCGPRGYPGMAEVGNMGLPPKVLKKGITDMIRISDAR